MTATFLVIMGSSFSPCWLSGLTDHRKPFSFCFFFLLVLGKEENKDMNSTDKQAPSVAKLLAGHSTGNARPSALICRGKDGLSSHFSRRQCTHRPEASVPLGLTQLLHSESFNCAQNTRHPPLLSWQNSWGLELAWCLGGWERCRTVWVCVYAVLRDLQLLEQLRKAKACLDFLQGVLPTFQAV